jgi:hypothetical protein
VHPRVDFGLVVAGGARNTDLTGHTLIRPAPERRFFTRDSVSDVTARYRILFQR